MLVIDDWESSIEGLKDWAVFELFEGFFFSLLARIQGIIGTDKHKGSTVPRPLPRSTSTDSTTLVGKRAHYRATVPMGTLTYLTSRMMAYR